VLAVLWPSFAIAAFHLAWGPELTGALAHPVLGLGLLLALPGALAIAAAEDSARSRRIIGATVATTSAIGVIAYGVLVFDTVGCGEAGDFGEVALSMLPVAVVVGLAAGFTAWQGGRLVTAFRRAGIPLAFVLGWTMLALALSGAIFRGLSVSCFGY
jgi:hypothetical protein